MTGPGASTNEVIFGDAVDGLFVKGLGERVTPPLREKLKGAGLDLDRARLPAYPRPVWNSAIALAATHVWPELSADEAHRRLGHTIIDGFRQTLLGHALAAMSKVLGPMRTLRRMRHNFRTGGNYNETTLEQEGPTCVVFWINEPTINPGYVQGMLEGSLELSGGKNASVVVVSQDAKGTTYRIRWDA